MVTPLQRGENVDYTPIADVAAGAVVKLGSNFYGVALSPIPANTLGALAVVGAFRFTASAAIAYGALLYYDSSTDKVSSVAVNGNYIGRSINVAAADGDESWGLLDAVNIGEFSAIVPGTAPTPTALTEPTTDGITGTTYTGQPALIAAAIGANYTNCSNNAADLAALIVLLKANGVLE